MWSEGVGGDKEGQVVRKEPLLNYISGNNVREIINFFIDASVFRKYQFNLWKTNFYNLGIYCSEGRARHFTTEIALKELESNIEEIADEGIKNIVRCNSLLGFMKIIRDLKLTEIKRADIEKELKNSLYDYMRASGASPLKDSCDVKGVFAKYFQRKPPFSAKKKNEFPDAFILSTLNENALKSDIKIYVISCDNDYSEINAEYKGLYYLPSLEKLLDTISSAFDNEGFIDQFNLWFEENIDFIKSDIMGEIENEEFYLNDVNGTIDTKYIKRIDIVEKNIIDIEHDCDEEVININIKANCLIGFSITYDEPFSESYDIEEHDKYISIEKIIPINTNFTITYDLHRCKFDIHGLNCEIEDSFINIKDD